MTRSDPRAVLSRPASPPDHVVAYGSEPEHLVDVHVPRTTPAALVVLLHGGFWRDVIDRVHTRSLADALRAEGYVVATPEYRRTPHAQWPQMRADLEAVRDALPSLLGDVDSRLVAPGPYSLIGHSAGGHLALWWGLSAPTSVERVVALAPVADLAAAYEADLDDGAVAALLGGSPGEHQADFDDANVATRLPATAPPVTILHGVEDQRVPVEHNRALGVTTFHELLGIEHFALIDPLSPAWPVVRDALR